MHPDDVDAEFERTAPIGHAINAIAQAEDAVGSPTPPDVAARLDQVIDDLTRPQPGPAQPPDNLGL